MKKAGLGSVTTGTLKIEDLLSAFLSELEWHVNRNGDFLSRPENFSVRDYFAALIGEAQDCFADGGETIAEDKEGKAEEVCQDLVEALGEFAPSYCYFGALTGDGADFGFFPDWTLIDELPTVDNGEEASKEGDDCKTVNDHGNVTVWSGGKATLELV